MLSGHLCPKFEERPSLHSTKWHYHSAVRGKICDNRENICDNGDNAKREMNHLNFNLAVINPLVLPCHKESFTSFFSSLPQPTPPPLISPPEKYFPFNSFIILVSQNFPSPGLSEGKKISVFLSFAFRCVVCGQFSVFYFNCYLRWGSGV